MDQSGQYDPNDPNQQNTIDTTNPDTIRQTAPYGTIRETQDGETLDANNNVADLPDGRQVEVPPSNLAAAKDALAAQNSAAGDVNQDDTDLNYDTSGTGLVGSPSNTGRGSTGVVGQPSSTGAGATGVAGSSATPSYGANPQNVSNDPAYNAPAQGIDPQGYDTVNQGLGSGQNYDPNQPNQGSQGGLTGSSQGYDPNMDNQAKQGGMLGAQGTDQGFDPGQGSQGGLSGQTGDQGWGATGAQPGYQPNQGGMGSMGAQPNQNFDPNAPTQPDQFGQDTLGGSQGLGASGQGYGGSIDNGNGQPYTDPNDPNANLRP